MRNTLDDRTQYPEAAKAVSPNETLLAFNGHRVASYAPILSCKGLWKIYGTVSHTLRAMLNEQSTSAEKFERLRRHGVNAAVADVSLDVRAGEILMIMGLSGSGKSTLLRCLSRLIEPEAGEIKFQGLDFLRTKRADLIDIRRRKIGMVFQNFGLMAHLSAIDNVAFPLRVRGLSSSERRNKARAMLELVGLGGREDCRPSQLSGGQQQRVGIARSLVTDPDLWLLDEPFSALDPLIRKQMQDEFQRLQAKLNKTIVFVTHDFLEAARLGDRIAIMKDGEVRQIGTALDFILNPADEYVKSFVADVHAAHVIKIGQIAMPATEPFALQGEPRIEATQVLDAALGYFLSGAPRIVVVNAEGAIVGTVDRDAMRSLRARSNATDS